MQRPAAMAEQQQQLECPRCESPNTKFCYYNNYNLSQPRHFCKDCRRYWTKGGALRNVPIGGGTRRKTSKRSSSSAAAGSKRPSPSPDTSNLQIPEPKSMISKAPPPLRPDDRLLNFDGGFCSLLASNDVASGNHLDGFSSGGAAASTLPDSGGLGMGLMQQQSSGDSNANEGAPLLPENVYSDLSCLTGDGCWPDLAIYTPSSSY